MKKKLLPDGRIFAVCNDYDVITKSFNTTVKWHHINNKYIGTKIPDEYKEYRLTFEQLYNQYANSEVRIQENK